jgi:hypothetical protein
MPSLDLAAAVAEIGSGDVGVIEPEWGEMTRTFRGGAAIFALVCVAQISGMALAAARDAKVTAQPDPTPAVAPYVIDPTKDAPLADSEMAALVRTKIKYVFVIFNENHSVSRLDPPRTLPDSRNPTRTSTGPT